MRRALRCVEGLWAADELRRESVSAVTKELEEDKQTSEAASTAETDADTAATAAAKKLATAQVQYWVASLGGSAIFAKLGGLCRPSSTPRWIPTRRRCWRTRAPVPR